MAEEVNLKARVGVESTGDDGIRKITNALAALSEQSQNLVAASKAMAKGLETAERSMAGIGTKAKAAASGVSTIAQEAKQAATALKSFEINGKKVEFEPFYGGKNFKNTADELIRQGRTVEQLKTQYRELEKVIRLSTDAAKNAGNLSGLGKSNRTWEKDPYNLANNPIKVSDFSSKAAANAAGVFDVQVKKMGQSLKTSFADIDIFNDKLANTRYALHDVSNTMGIAGAAMLAFSAIFIKAGADYESAMANIQRTGELSNNQTAEMRKQFVGIAQEIPAAFADIAKVGELAGQLNIPTERIEAFSESVLKFSATTNVTAEAAATAFGRLDALLPDVQGNYDALGSSILKVGINSVATEQEIISTTSQIAAAGAQAGMSADQIIGLSASFASLGVAPEAARGTVIRVLGLMNAAVAEGGAKLDDFARIAGTSAQQFQNSWGSAEFSDTFLGFLRGLESEGNAAQLALKDLGIWAARDQNNLLKLSQNAGLVAGTFSEAADGMNDAGILSDNFAIKSDTLNSQLQLLLNNAQAFAATLGEANNGAVKMFVESLNKILKAATDLAANPVVQWASTVVAGLILINGAALLLTSGFARFGASMLAARPVMGLIGQSAEVIRNRFMIAERAVSAFGTTTTTMGAKAQAAAVMVRGLAGALRGIGTGLAIGAAMTVAFAGAEAVMKALKSNADKAKDAFGDMSALAAASAQDAADAKKEYGSLSKAITESGGEYSVMIARIDGSNEKLQESVGATGAAAAGQDELGAAVDATTAKFENQIIVIGQSARAEMRNLIGSQDGLKKSLLQLEQIGFPLDTYMQQLMTDLPAAEATQKRFIAEVDRNGTAMLNAAKEASGFTMTGYELNNALQQLAGGADLVSGAYTNLAFEQAWAEAEGRVFGETAESNTIVLDAFAEGGEAAASAMSNLAQEISYAFSEINNTAGLSTAISEIIQLAEVGALAGEYMTGGVLENVGTIESAIEKSIIAGQLAGIGATESVSALFDALAAKGVDTANLLSSLMGLGVNNVAGVHLKDVYSGLGKETSRLSGFFQGLDKQLNRTTKSMGGGGGGAAKAAKELKEEVRTLTDYANDLSGVWGRAFEIRFGSTKALDAIRKQFNDLAEAAIESRKAIRDLQNDIQSLQSKIQLQEFFLSVAVMYQDDKAAGAIEANLAKSRAELEDKTSSLRKEEAKNSKTLTGTSAAAIENRKEVLASVQAYQDYIKSLAGSGMSQAQLAATTAQLQQDFMNQFTQLGYNSSELAVYASAFGDVSTAISKVPRNVTVTANVNPAIQAFNEFQAKANANMKSVNDSINGLRANAGGGISLPAIINPTNAAGIRRAALEAEIVAAAAMLERLKAIGDWNGVRYQMQGLARLRNDLRVGNYWTGGFTGRGGKYEPKGMVHGGEYVFPKTDVNQSTGTPKPEAMMKFMPRQSPTSGAQSASSGIGLTALTPGTIQALARELQTVLVINDKVLGEVTSKAYSNANDIGSY